jgi:y4mF family transcriptional regulator
MIKGTVDSPQALGTLVRSRRKDLGLTQTQLADVAMTTLRFISELERGKPSAQMDGVFRVLSALGIRIDARSR